MYQPYSYSPITRRGDFRLPDGYDLAFYIGLNVERFRFDVASDPGTPSPDPLNQGLRDYGPRVGIWRLIEVFDEVGLPVSALTNSDVCLAYPEIVAAGIERGWAWIAHGQTNSIRVSGMPVVEETKHLTEMHSVFTDSLPTPPVGWLGPRLGETFNTLPILGNLGYRYVMDWCCDDQPFKLDISPFYSVPYSQEVNDLVLYLKGFPAGGYEGRIMAQFEQLLADSAGTPRVMALPLHPYVSGQAWLVRELRSALTKIARTERVWLCTSDDIARAAGALGEAES
jgi:allantoinase